MIAQFLSNITTQIINPLIVFLFALGTLLFIWGIVLYILGSQGDEAKLEKGKKAILYGIIGMFIMASAWGIVRLMCDFFSVTNCG